LLYTQLFNPATSARVNVSAKKANYKMENVKANFVAINKIANSDNALCFCNTNNELRINDFKRIKSNEQCAENNQSHSP
jgi:hypothetical protein